MFGTVCVVLFCFIAAVRRAGVRSAGISFIVLYTVARSDVCYSAAFDVKLIYYVLGFHIFYQT